MWKAVFSSAVETVGKMFSLQCLKNCTYIYNYYSNMMLTFCRAESVVGMACMWQYWLGTEMVVPPLGSSFNTWYLSLSPFRPPFQGFHVVRASFRNDSGRYFLSNTTVQHAKITSRSWLVIQLSGSAHPCISNTSWNLVSNNPRFTEGFHSTYVPFPFVVTFLFYCRRGILISWPEILTWS